MTLKIPGRTPLEGELSNELEMWNSTLDTWQARPDLAMEEARCNMVLVVVMSKSFMTITSKLVMMNCCGCEP